MNNVTDNRYTVTSAGTVGTPTISNATFPAEDEQRVPSERVYVLDDESETQSSDEIFDELEDDDHIATSGSGSRLGGTDGGSGVTGYSAGTSSGTGF